MGRTHELSPVAEFSLWITGNVSTLSEQEQRDPGVALTIR
jgi:hypothetical protein